MIDKIKYYQTKLILYHISIKRSKRVGFFTKMFILKTKIIGKIDHWVKSASLKVGQSCLDRSGNMESNRYSVLALIPTAQYCDQIGEEREETQSKVQSKIADFEQWLILQKSKYLNQLNEYFLVDEAQIEWLTKIPDSCSSETASELKHRLLDEKNKQLPKDQVDLIQAWVIGGIAYECGYELQGLVLDSRKKKQIRLPSIWAFFYECVYLWDHAQDIGILMALTTEGLIATLKEIYQPTRHIENLNVAHEIPHRFELIPHTSLQEYQHRFQAVKAKIEQGEIYQCNLTINLQSFGFEHLDPTQVYLSLKQDQVLPYACLIRLSEDQSILSFSPEHFASWDQSGKIFTSPIKGTRKLGKTEDENEKIAQELMSSIKDQAEHLMIVDLERNDLGRICEAGTVQLRSLKALHVFPTVMHLVSVIEGKLKKEISMTDIFQAIFPGGSITGAPKKRSMSVIDEVEKDCREIYCGAIGYFNFNEEASLSIPIRTAWIDGDVLYYSAGGGIVYDSQMDQEWDELWVKCRYLIKGLEKLNTSL
jgi:para-aminobenzoate synthetase component 1